MGYYKAVKLCKSVNTELLFLVIKSNDIDDHFSKNTLPVNHCMNKHPTKLLLTEALTCGGGSLADEDAHRSTLLWHHAIFRTPSGTPTIPLHTHFLCFCNFSDEFTARISLINFYHITTHRWCLPEAIRSGADSSYKTFLQR